jgi:hypothetical protein
MSKINKLDEETALFLKQALSGLTIKEAGFDDAWMAIQNMLQLARNKDGNRMFHWVTLVIATVTVMPTCSDEDVEVGRFNRVGGDASVAASRHFELYA